MNTNHTPGPWTEGKRCDDKPKAMIDPNFVQPWINIDPVPKSDLDILNGMSCVCTVVGPDREANARLIAAAPDLLEAVKDMMHDIEIFYSHHREPGNKYLINLKAAIAKSEGR